jgi:bacterioferritin-associated ferredoxin
MNEIDEENVQERICYCSGTTKQQIEALINSGITNLERISRITGACSGCGACDGVIMELIAKKLSFANLH